MKIGFIFALFFTLSTIGLAQPPRAPHPQPKIQAAKGELPEQAVQDAILAALEAIEADDFANFARLGNDTFKAQLKKDWFDETVKVRAARLEKGYNVVYFGEVKRAAYTVHMWKLVFADKGDEWLGEISWKNGQMDGFKIH